VVAAMRVQDPCSLLAAQDLHRGDVDPGRCEFLREGRDLRLLSQQADHVVGGPVIEVIDVDLRIVHIAAPGRAVPGRRANTTCRRSAPPHASCRLSRTDQLGCIA
jgi:hypothetical protein